MGAYLIVPSAVQCSLQPSFSFPSSYRSQSMEPSKQTSCVLTCMSEEESIMASTFILIHCWLLHKWHHVCSSESRTWDKHPLKRNVKVRRVKQERRTHQCMGHYWDHHCGQWRLDFDTPSRCLVNTCLVNKWVHIIGNGVGKFYEPPNPVLTYVQMSQDDR